MQDALEEVEATNKQRSIEQYEKDVMCERCQKNKECYFGEARSSEWGARQKTSVEKFDVSVALSMYIMTMNIIIDTSVHICIH